MPYTYVDIDKRAQEVRGGSLSWLVSRRASARFLFVYSNPLVLSTCSLAVRDVSSVTIRVIWTKIWYHNTRTVWIFIQNHKIRSNLLFGKILIFQFWGDPLSSFSLRILVLQMMSGTLHAQLTMWNTFWSQSVNYTYTILWSISAMTMDSLGSCSNVTNTEFA